jgi:hypothetical protein
MCRLNGDSLMLPINEDTVILSSWSYMMSCLISFNMSAQDFGVFYVKKQSN